MKNFFWIPIAFVLLPVAAWPQALPDAPAPAPPYAAPPYATAPYAQAPAPPSAPWYRVQQISDGAWIVVRTNLGAQVRCRFAGATDTWLFCDPPSPGPVSSQPGYRFDRASVIGVSEIRPEGDQHPGLLAAMAIAGTVVGLAVSRNTTDGAAAGAGILTAAGVWVIGGTMIQMHSQNAGFGMSFPLLEFGRGAPRPLGLRPRMPMPIRPMRLVLPTR